MVMMLQNLDDGEMAELEELFASRPANAKVAAGAGGGNKKRLHFMDMKRANNLGIGLAQFKSFATFSDLATAVRDGQIPAFTLEQVCAFDSIRFHSMLGFTPH